MSAPTTIPQPEMAALVTRQRAQAALVSQEELAKSPELSEADVLDLRHQLLDLDPDSHFDYPGACCVACPPRDTTGGQP